MTRQAHTKRKKPKGESTAITGNFYQSRLVDGVVQISIQDDKDDRLVGTKKEDCGACTVSKDNNDSTTNTNLSNVVASTTTTAKNRIPETVLQFERQRRKLRAAQKVIQPVNNKTHLRILYEDDHVVVTDKPSGILCVPGVHERRNSLLNLVHAQFPLDDVMMDQRIVHRLDMDTSGLVVFGRSVAAVSQLHQQFRDGAVKKAYHALVCGHLPYESGNIQLALQRDHAHPPFMRVATRDSNAAAAIAVQDLQHHGYKKLMMKRPKPSHTEFQVLAREWLDPEKQRLPVTRLQLTPHTGRTHQLRVHCAAMGHAIVADPVYGIMGEASPNGGFDADAMERMAPHRASLTLQQQILQFVGEDAPMCLHSQTLGLQHPVTKQDMVWEAPTPF